MLLLILEKLPTWQYYRVNRIAILGWVSLYTSSFDCNISLSSFLPFFINLCSLALSLTLKETWPLADINLKNVKSVILLDGKVGLICLRLTYFFHQSGFHFLNFYISSLLKYSKQAIH